MTKEEFKQKWEANEKGSCITFDDIANCAKEWGLYDKPKCYDLRTVRYKVLKAAKCVDAEEYNPNPKGSNIKKIEDKLIELHNLLCETPLDYEEKRTKYKRIKRKIEELLLTEFL